MQGMRETARRYAVIDVGSNSIRLVIFDRLSRGLSVMFNEKVLCGLGSDLEVTGRLTQKAVDQALANLSRFTELTRAMDVESVDAVATAAVRDAADGRLFVKRVAQECALKLRILSGEEECEYTALGVLSSVPRADGLVGDLGGGSLELVRISGNEISDGFTLPLGPLRLVARDAGKRGDLITDIERVLENVTQSQIPSGEIFYLVGGNWRSLARLHMAQTDYPLRVVHCYTVGYEEIYEFVDLISKQSPTSLIGVSSIAERRLKLLPVGATVLLALLRRFRPREVIFSGTGLREGLAYAKLGAHERARDPLISVCQDLAHRVARFPSHGDELAAWIGSIFLSESPRERRLRHAACLLSDIAWRVHPDYRAEYALMEALWLQAAINHTGRTFLGLAIMHRYSSKKIPKLATQVKHLLDPNALCQARAVGLAARVGETLCGGVPGLLSSFNLVRHEDRLTLEHQPKDSRMIGHVVRARFRALAKHLSLKASIEVIGS